MEEEEAAEDTAKAVKNSEAEKEAPAAEGPEDDALLQTEEAAGTVQGAETVIKVVETRNTVKPTAVINTAINSITPMTIRKVAAVPVIHRGVTMTISTDSKHISP